MVAGSCPTDLVMHQQGNLVDPKKTHKVCLRQPTCMQAMDKSLNTLTPLCDFVARINNEGHEPTLVAFETVDTKGNWRVISDRFARRGG